MIEMLGVLAIVGVLSVGGIAGYSKAMLMYKSNKQMEQINRLFHTMLPLGFSLGKPESKGTINLIPILKAMNEIPEEMLKNNNERYVYDALGNQIYIQSVSAGNGTVITHSYQEFHFNLYETDDALESCRNFFKFAKQNSKFIWQIANRDLNSPELGSSRIYGDKYCTKIANRKCIRDISLTEIQESCSFCKTNPCYFMVAWNNTGEY